MHDVIVVTDLVKKYGDHVTVLDGLTFSVVSGDFIAVYGKSGCGKTTLLNILGGLDRPTSGIVSIEGEEVANMSEDGLARLRLNKIGFVFQDYNLLNDITVRENLLLPLKFSRRQNGERIDRLLSKFGIDHIADENANKISGGEAQRTAIARAMVNEPSILIADEPTGNLDEENAENVMDMFQVARAEFKATIVMATHSSDIARRANHKIQLTNGRIVPIVG